jgi:hypothetical protein
LKRGWESREEHFSGQIEQVRPSTETSAPSKPCHPMPGDGLGLVWLRAIFCTFLPHRWFSPYDSDSCAEDALHVSPAPRRFAPAGLDQAGAPHQTIAGRSRHGMGESKLPEPDSYPALPRSPTELDLLWRTPWPYLFILLLVLLLLY